MSAAECAAEFERVPDELVALPRWVLWRAEQRNGDPKRTKVPYIPRDPQRRASTTSPSSWGTFNEALKAYCDRQGDGIGFVLTTGDGFVGIDLDGVLDDDGQLRADALDGEAGPWVAALGGYVERSPSGRGLHLLGRGQLPTWARNRRGQVEVYANSRFLTITGEVFEGLGQLRPLRELEAFLDAAGLRREPPSTNGQPLATVSIELADGELLARAFSHRNGREFRALFEGSWEGRYPSASEADMSLACHLAWLTGRDPVRVDRLFRSSGLIRAKWDAKRGESSYGAQTIARACALTSEVYSASAAANDEASLVPPAVEREVAPADESEPKGPDLIGFPFTDLGNARRFAAMHKEGFLHAREERVWLEWRDGRWRRDRTGAAERAAKEVVEELWKQVVELPDEKRERAAKWAIGCQSEQRLRAMLSLASTEPGMYVRLQDLDADPWLLSCGNGTLDLRTGELRAPDPDDLISRGTDVHYVHDASRDRWERFLREVFDADRALISFVKRAYGSCLTGDTRDRALFVEYGPRFNGKSTLNKAIQRTLGDFAHTAPIRVVMRSRESEIPNEIAAVARKRLSSSPRPRTAIDSMRTA